MEKTRGSAPTSVERMPSVESLRRRAPSRMKTLPMRSAASPKGALPRSALGPGPSAMPSWPNLPATVVTTPAGVQKGAVPISYTLLDPAGLTCTIAVEYSINGGGAWQPAKAASGGDGTSDLASSPGGVPHVFTWNSPFAGDHGSLVTVDFNARGGGTEIVITHERLPSEEMVQAHSGGWSSILERIAESRAQ